MTAFPSKNPINSSLRIFALAKAPLCVASRLPIADFDEFGVGVTHDSYSSSIKRRRFPWSRLARFAQEFRRSAAEFGVIERLNWQGAQGAGASHRGSVLHAGSVEISVVA